MNTIKYIGALMMSVICLCSCEDFLDRENPNQVTQENYWDTVEDCENALNSVYNAFKAPEIYQFVDENLRSDLGIQGGNSRSGTSDAMLHTFNDAYASMTNKWQALYKGIFRANQVIEGVAITRTKLDMTIPAYVRNLNYIEAQAYFFRGLFYFWLNNMYNNGEVPIIDYVPVNMPDDLYQPVSSSEDVKNFYRADMIKALEVGLPDDWNDNSDLGRVNTGAAYSILGMSYLYDKDYQTARYYFDLVINYLNYELSSKNNQATTRNEFGSESILEANYTLEINTQYSGESAIYNNYGMLVSQVGGWYSIVPALWLVDEFENDPVDSANPKNWVEVEFDTFANPTNPTNPDIIYKHLGDRVGTESSSGATYLVYQYNGLADDGVGLNYGTKLYKKTVVYDEPDETEYKEFTVGNNYIDPYVIHAHDGEWVHERIYSHRASNSIALNGDNYLSYYTLTVQEAGSFNNGNTGYFRKYSNWDIWRHETDGTPVNQSGINLRVIRLADIYLLYAEALLEGGATSSYIDEALTYINRVRERAGVVLLGTNGEFNDGEHTYDGVSYTAEQLMKHLMYVERPLELCLDGNALRQVDLRRWGVTKKRLSQLSTQRYGLVATGAPYVKVDEDDPSIYTNETKYHRQKPEQWFLDNGKTTGTYYVDFGQSSINYNDSKAYWPIPSVEKIANPYID